MRQRALALAAKRNALRAHCEIQRAHLAQTAHEIQERLARVDNGIAVIKRYAKQPLLIALGVGMIAMLGPRRIVGWLSRSAFLLASGQRVLRLIRSRTH